MVYNPSGRTPNYFVGWAVINALLAVAMVGLTFVNPQVRVLGWVAAALLAGLAVAGLFAAAKARAADNRRAV